MRMRMQKVTCLSKVLGGLTLGCFALIGRPGVRGSMGDGTGARLERLAVCSRNGLEETTIRWRALLNVGKVR